MDRIRFSVYARFLLKAVPSPCPFSLSSLNGFQCVGSGLSLEPPATTEADEEEDGMSDIIQEVTVTTSTIRSVMTTHCSDCMFNG